jgi:Cu+-exporting ATPase
MKTDPICEMQVDEKTALRAERDGRIFYFCSEHCRQEFLSPPEAAVRPVTDHECCHSDESEGKAQSGEHHRHEQGHHGHAPAHRHGHDIGTVKPSGTAKYFCPMCPGVESDEPGTCPKCGNGT